MLKQRVITALILAPIALAAIFLLPPAMFSLFIGLIVLLGVVEFGRLSGISDRKVIFIALAVLTILMLLSHFVFSQLAWVLVLASVFWLGICLLLFIRNRAPVKTLAQPSYLTLLSGVLLLWFCWLALSLLRQTGDQGSWLVMYVFLVIWAADVGAYFTGKAMGKNKLAVNISPGKTIEGVMGGLVLALLFTVVAHQWILTAIPLNILLAIATVMAIISVVGDLFESLLKRQRSMKDSGSILPGHGGILDRTDSVIAAAPVFFTLLWYFNHIG